MSAADRVVFILNERYVSSDLNILENLWARWLTDALVYRDAQVLPAVSSSAVGAPVLMQAVLGGLEVSANGTSIDVAKGALVQTSPIAPVTDDPITAMAIGFNTATLTLATPAPGGDTWCLVQAQVQDVADGTVTVDIFNGSVFVPTAGQVKRRRRTLNVTIKETGGTATSIPAPDAGFIPIAALFRPGGGGAVTNAAIVDIRPMLPVPHGTPHELRDHFYRTNDLAGTQTTITMSVRVGSQNGEMHFEPSSSSPTAFQPEAAAWKETGSPALAANEWWYLYMCPLVIGGLPAIRPRHLYANYKSEGVLVMSQVAPRTNLRDNSALITLPQPFAAHTVPIGQAVFVGAIRRNAGNTGWVPMSGVRGHVRFSDKAFYDIAAGAAPLAMFTATGGSNVLPAGARAFDVTVLAATAGAASTTVAVEDPAGTVQRYVESFDAAFINTLQFLQCDLSVGQSYQIAEVAGGGGTYAAKILGFDI